MFINGLAIIIIASLLLLAVTRLTVERVAHNHHAQKVSFFNRYPVQPGDIVFLGDSITDGARWDELFPGLPVKNRGINANLTTNVLERLDNIVNWRPKAIFILIGPTTCPGLSAGATSKSSKRTRPSCGASKMTRPRPAFSSNPSCRARKAKPRAFKN